MEASCEPTTAAATAIKEATTSNRSGADNLSEGARATPAASKPRKSRRRRTRNSAADSKRKGVASSVDCRTKEPQKNTSRTSCASAPLPSTSQTAGSVALQPAGLRPRSLYTTHTYQAQPPPPAEEAGFRPPSWPRETAARPRQLRSAATAELGKYGLEPPPSCEQQQQQQQQQQWSGASFSNIPVALWRHQQQQQPVIARAGNSPKPSAGLQQFYREESGLCGYADGWRGEHECPEAGLAGAMATPHGTISLRLHNKIRLDMTIDRAVRLINLKNNIVLSLSGSGSASALLHPNGRIYQYGSRVEILAHDNQGNNKYAKMWYKGVSFTSEQCALVYLVDAAGARTTTDSFSDMSQDFSVNVFYAESRHGPAYIQDAAAALSAAQYWITDEGVENWIINNIRVSQTPDGLVRIGRNSNKYQLRTSPSNGTASLTTPFLHCTASLGQTPHLFVRRGERRMHYDGTSFIVRNAGHSAGFDDNNQLKVY